MTDNVTVTDYENGRSLIKDGDIIFIRNKKHITSRIIHFFTMSKYSHVGIAFWAKVGGISRLMMVEAQGGNKLRIVNISYYTNDQLDVVPAPKPWASVMGLALQHVGLNRYGWLDALYVGLREFTFNLTGIRLPRLNFPGEICSEFVARIYDTPDWNVSPQRLFEQLSDSGYTPYIHIR